MTSREGARVEFRDAYHDLEEKWRAQAEADGHVYLPNPEPSEPADWVFICMEPSFSWARGSTEVARATVAAGFRNFLAGREILILHFCIRHYLCAPGEHYHITDFSKGAMSEEDADIERTPRWERWYTLLVEEVDLVATPSAGIFAVGTEVDKHLRVKFPRPVTKVLHYSGQNTRAWQKALVGHESGFDQFKRSTSLKRFLATAEEVLNASAPPFLRDQTLSQLKRQGLPDSRKQLMYYYKLEFERHNSRVGRGGEGGARQDRPQHTREADAEDDRIIALMNVRRADAGRLPLSPSQESSVRESRRIERESLSGT